jgi:hypothetical protein
MASECAVDALRKMSEVIEAQERMSAQGDVIEALNTAALRQSFNLKRFILRLKN